MNFCDINPFIRFAEYVNHQTSLKNPVFVKDCRIFYIISGKAEIFIENQHYELIPDSLFYCREESIYDIRSSNVRLISLNFDLSQEDNGHTEFYSPISTEKSLQSTSTRPGLSEDCDFLSSHLFLANAGECRETLEEILREFSTQKMFYRENSSSLLKTVLVMLYRHSIASTHSSSAAAILRILDYLKTNYAKPLTNKELSSMCGYHEYHLNRLFLKHTGMSIHKYILTIRINEAKKLLLNTDHTLAFIAEKVGFNSNTHFSSYFKQIVGVTPLEFRKQFH